MIVDKVFITRLELVKTKDMFTDAYDKMVLQHLNTLIGTCFQSTYILEILRIINRTPPTCERRSLTGYTIIDVMFEARVLVYEENEIIHDCTIVHIADNGNVYAKSKYASICIRVIDKTFTYKLNERVPVMVNLTRYNARDSEIAIVAIPLMPIPTNHFVYKVIGKPSLSTPSHSLQSIDSMKKELRSAEPKMVEFFKKILFPLTKWVEPTERLVDIATLKLDDGMCILNINRYLDDTKVYICNTNVSGLPVVDVTADNLMDMLTHEVERNLHTLLEFLKHYNTIELAQSMAHVWKAYTMHKQEIA